MAAHLTEVQLGFIWIHINKALQILHYVKLDDKGIFLRSAGALGAIGRGTFGGARQALMQSEQERNLATEFRRHPS
jgi:hypothetical protein